MGLMWGEAQSTRGEGGVVLGEDLARGITGTDTNYRAWNWGENRLQRMDYSHPVLDLGTRICSHGLAIS